MPDTKITALAAITTVDPAADVLPIVDISDTSMAASGTTKKITSNQILGAGGTATLASATITGDLTVDTSTLKVDSANNRVGVLTTSPLYALDVNGDAKVTNALRYFVGSTQYGLSFANAGALGIESYQGTYIFLGTGSGASATERYRIASDGVATWSNVGGVAGTAMTLNANGLGIGVTPSAYGTGIKGLDLGAWTSVAQIGAASFYGFNSYASTTGQFNYKNSGAIALGYFQTTSGHLWLNAPSNAGAAGANASFTTAMTLDASGNLLVGTTSQNGSWNTKLTLSNDSGTTKWAVGPYLGGVTNFLISAGASAGVYLNGTAATSWTSASDERLKDIIEPISNAIAKVGSLRAVIGKFKFDENNTRKPFLIAQDIQAVLPEAVDASNPEKLGVAYTDVIPLLVAAIKELTARVQTLETR